jgi:hypothetical protein
VEFAFVLGTGRCGSTLVHEVLARHPKVGFVSNLDNRLAPLNLKGKLNGPLYRALPRSMSGFTTKGTVAGWGAQQEERTDGWLRRWFGSSEAYDLIERRVGLPVRRLDRDLTAEDARTELGLRFHRFFTDRARVQRCEVFVHDFTGWPRARFIQEVLPGARFLHVVRDGRAVANSLVRTSWWRGHAGPEEWGFGTLPPGYEREWQESRRSATVLAGIQWKLLMDAFDAARAAVPQERWLEVRFGDLLASPREETARMLSFIGLEWPDAFERQFGRIAFRAARRGAFTSELGPGDAALLDRTLRENLERHGYARVG